MNIVVYLIALPIFKGVPWVLISNDGGPELLHAGGIVDMRSMAFHKFPLWVRRAFLAASKLSVKLWVGH